MMDTLHSYIFERPELKRIIRETEKRYPRLKVENKRIRVLAKMNDIKVVLAEKHIDIGAALLSSCRSDMLNCGRCAFWNALHGAGLVRGFSHYV